MTTKTTQSWTGWFRLLGSDRWEETCHADTEARTWTLLLDVAEAGDKLVLQAGRRPDDRPRQGALFA
jgi:nuclear transport factor 2 (NTF2) superfamily protein